MLTFFGAGCAHTGSDDPSGVGDPIGASTPSSGETGPNSVGDRSDMIFMSEEDSLHKGFSRNEAPISLGTGHVAPRHPSDPLTLNAPVDSAASNNTPVSPGRIEIAAHSERGLSEGHSLPMPNHQIAEGGSLRGREPATPVERPSLPIDKENASAQKVNAEGDALKMESIEHHSVASQVRVEGGEGGARLRGVSSEGYAERRQATSASEQPAISPSPSDVKQRTSGAGSKGARSVESVVRSETIADPADSFKGNDSQSLKPLRGPITGLTQAGLVLTDSIGNVIRPKPGANMFEFRGGDAYLGPDEEYQLIIARQPLMESCRVQVSKQGPPANAILCAPGQNSTVSYPPATMRDCFRVKARGAAFSLGYKHPLDGKSAWHSYADVATSPVGVTRQQHKTFVDGALILEAITHISLATSMVSIEWLRFSGGVEAAAFRRIGMAGGMPLDLEIGETRNFTVTSSNKKENEAQARVASVEHRVKLVSIGPLATQAGHFELTCHIEEWSADSGHTNNSWYAPGYGAIKTEVRLPAGSRRALEVIDIQQRPD